MGRLRFFYKAANYRGEGAGRKVNVTVCMYGSTRIRLSVGSAPLGLRSLMRYQPQQADIQESTLFTPPLPTFSSITSSRCHNW